jgi:hypothetical protein
LALLSINNIPKRVTVSRENKINGLETFNARKSTEKLKIFSSFITFPVCLLHFKYCRLHAPKGQKYSYFRGVKMSLFTPKVQIIRTKLLSFVGSYAISTGK